MVATEMTSTIRLDEEGDDIEDGLFYIGGRLQIVAGSLDADLPREDTRIQELWHWERAKIDASVPLWPPCLVYLVSSGPKCWLPTKIKLATEWISSFRACCRPKWFSHHQGMPLFTFTRSLDAQHRFCQDLPKTSFPIYRFITRFLLKKFPITFKAILICPLKRYYSWHRPYWRF